MHSHSLSKSNGVTLWQDFDYNSQSGTIQQNYNVKGEVNLKLS